MVKHMISLKNICACEPGQLYAVDIAILKNKSELASTDIKEVNIVELLTSKTSNSYVSLENAGNSFFFVATKLKPLKAKKISLQNAVLPTSTRNSIVVSTTINKNNGDRDEKSIHNKLYVEPSPQARSRVDSSGPFPKSYSPFVAHDSKTANVSQNNSDKKSMLRKNSKFNEYSSEIVNIYRKPLYGNLTRNKNKYVRARHI